MATGAALAVLIGVVFVLSRPAGQRLTWAIAWVVFLAVLIAAPFLFDRRTFARVGLTLTAGKLVYTSVFGTRAVSLEGELKVVEISIQGKTATWPMWLLVAEDGRCELTVNTTLFGKAQLDEMTQRLGLPHQTIARVMTLQQAQTEYPGFTMRGGSS